MKIQESAENYLETILILSQTGTPIRSIDIVNELGFSKPSVSVAMKQLRENGYVRMEQDGSIVLLDKGRQIAEKIYERHCLIAKMLMAIGVDEETAFADACKIEHDVSETTFLCMKRHLEACDRRGTGGEQRG